MEDTFDLWTSLDRIHEKFLSSAIEQCAKGGVAPSLVALQLDSCGEVVDVFPIPREIVEFYFSSEAGKEMFSVFLREVFMPKSNFRQHLQSNENVMAIPDVLVQVNEAWGVKASEIGGVAPSEHPNRIECLMITLHTEYGSVLTAHPISGTPERQVDRQKFPQRDANFFRSIQSRLAVPSSDHERQIH